MVRTIRVTVCTPIIFIMLAMPSLFAQNAFEDAIARLTSDNVRGYIQPMADGLGANINSGLIGPAHIPDGFHLRVTISGMAASIGDGEKTYMATAPNPYTQTPIETATIFGGDGTVLNGPSGMRYYFQSGQIRASFMPFATPQITVGNFYGTQAVIRFAPVPSIDDFPDVSFFGIGARHSVSRYFSEIPLDIAAGIFYQSLSVGDLLSANSFALTAAASKTFSVLTLYGGLQYETFGVDLEYTYEGSSTGAGDTDTTISLSMDGRNKIRIAGGAALSLGFIHLNGDIQIGKLTVFTVGLGFGM